LDHSRLPNVFFFLCFRRTINVKGDLNESTTAAHIAIWQRASAQELLYLKRTLTEFPKTWWVLVGLTSHISHGNCDHVRGLAPQQTRSQGM